jgi:hypothetical protein
VSMAVEDHEGNPFKYLVSSLAFTRAGCPHSITENPLTQHGLAVSRHTGNVYFTQPSKTLEPSVRRAPHTSRHKRA